MGMTRFPEVAPEFEGSVSWDVSTTYMLEGVAH